jgi:threonine synthase
MPDYVAVSVGDGCTIGGVWKGFKDLYQAGMIDRLPRIISVQASGCCPINTAAAAGTTEWIPQEENTMADSIAVGVPRNPIKALRAISESDGVVINVSDEEIMAAMRLLGTRAGVFAEPAGAAGTAGVKKAIETGLIERDASVVSIVTGNGLKDVNNAIRAAGEPMSVKPDMNALLEAFAERGVRVPE